MKQPEINLAMLPGGNSNRSYMNAKQYGFKFKAAEKQYSNRCEKRVKIIENIGERPLPFHVILSYICIGIAIVFACIEAMNVQTTIVGALNVSEAAAVICGVVFAASGMVFGHLMATNWKKDEFSGKYKPLPRFYIGLVFTVAYLGGQYSLASSAGAGIEEMQEATTTMKWFVLGIAVCEILFGIAFLGTAFKVFTLTIANLRIKAAMGGMKSNSKACEFAWQRYSFENNGVNLMEETQAIKDARLFYNTGGFDGQDIQSPF
jgi:hypothetical protein